VREVRDAFIEYLRGRLLGGFDVWLIEGVDTEDVSSHRDRELPAEALRPHAVTIHVREADYRMLRTVDAPAVRLIAEADEKAIVVVYGVVAQRLARHRQNADPLLAGRFGDQLLEPHAKGGHLGRQDESELVATLARGITDGGSETHPGVRLGRMVRQAGGDHLARA